MIEQLQNAESLMNSIMALHRPLTKDQLCEYLGIERTTLETYNMKGLPRFKLGQEVRYLLPDVIDWFRKGSNQHRRKENFSYETEGL